MEFSASNLELGRLYFERGDILKAIEVLEPLVNSLLEKKAYDHYLDTLHVLFRAYAEHLDFDKIEKEKDRLLVLTAQEHVKMSSKIYYVLALCASYKNEHDKSVEYCQKGLSAGLAEGNKEAVCYAISGLAISYYSQDRLQDALKEIFNLQIFMDVLDLPQIRISSHILKGHILRKMGKYDQALDVLWQSYDVLKNYKNFYIQISVFIGLALTYKQAGKISEAKHYIDLASRSINHDNLRKLSLHVKELHDSIFQGHGNETKHDLVFNLSEHAIYERNKGRVDFGNQFILMDLLKLFAQQPGVSFSKESLVKYIWKQSYNPAIHDNKIYVTIKRLRQLIEPDVEKPKYIFRSKNGYYLNKDISVLVESANQRERV